MTNNPFPSFGDFPQGMDFLKQVWSQSPTSPAASSAPAFQQAMSQYMMPTMDVDELDKRIGDMRTVLQFMEMNTNMLRQSLNALEVQRSTIAALHAMAKPQTGDSAATTQVPSWLATWQSMMQAPVAQPTPPASKSAPKKAVAKKVKKA